MPRPPEILTFTWRNVTCRVEHIRDWRNEGWSRLILRVAHPRGAPLPLTENSYFEHQMDEDDIKLSGGVINFFIAWLDRDALSTRYAQALYAWNQGDLFR